MTDKHIPRILLVDSEPCWRNTAKFALQKQGRYEVESVADLQAALESSSATGFDLILINAVLAFQEEAKFKEMVRLHKDKVLVISDVRSISTAIQVFKMGADYADKPFEPKRIIELVATQLQQGYTTG